MHQTFRRLAAAMAVLAVASGGAFAQSAEQTADDQAAQQQPADGPAPVATGLDARDAGVAERLRELVATRLARSIERRQDRAGVEAFYRDRGFAPLWVAEGAAAPRAKAAIAFLRGVEADGLSPADYPTPDFAGETPEALAQHELALTNAVLAFARHAQTGRVSYSRVSAAIHYDLQVPEPAQVLAQIASAGDVGEALAAYHPPHPGYRALKAELAKARQANDAKLVDTLTANMERWRWVPRDLGKVHVTVNVPDYSLKVTDQDRTVWSTRIVVGKPGTKATPLISDTIRFITVNPTWNVPPSIIRNEYLPALARDPQALERIGLKLTRAKDGTIRIHQPPGERNALGRIRFNFPNRFLVYQHDTPDKHLFEKEQRAFSHGCMRVQNPDRYAEVLLSIAQPEENYTAERIRGLYGKGERNIQLKTPIPVHLTYQTAFVDDAGRLQLRADLYGHDRDIISLLRGGRGSADRPVARNQNSSSKPVTARASNRTDSYAQGRRTDWFFGWNGGRTGRGFDSGPAVDPQANYGAPQ